MTSPAVSVVVATHDRAPRLRALLASLKAQTVDDFEVIVVDDGSADETPDVLAEDGHGLNLRTIRREVAEGPAVARNEGWRAARAPVVAFIDDDCVATPRWLEEGLAACRRWPGLIVQGRTDANPEEEHRRGPFSRTVNTRAAGPFFQTCNIFYERELLERLNGFDERFPKPGGEDTDLAWRAIESGVDARFVEEARVYHAVEDHGPVGYLRLALRWSDSMLVFRLHPGLRREVFTARVFWKKSHAFFAQALLGVLLARRSRVFLLLALPYARHLVGFRCWWSHSRRIWIPYFVLYDVVETFAALRGALKYRVPVA